jgi:hypothetical protein
MSKKFDKLNDSNWGQWKMFTRALLCKKNVWDVVNGSENLPAGSPNSKPIRAFQAEALAKITLHVKVPQLSFIQDDDLRAVWDAVTNVHRIHGMATQLTLNCCFLHLQKPEGPMQNFISKALHLAREL